MSSLDQHNCHNYKRQTSNSRWRIVLASSLISHVVTGPFGALGPSDDNDDDEEEEESDDDGHEEEEEEGDEEEEYIGPPRQALSE